MSISFWSTTLTTQRYYDVVPREDSLGQFFNRGLAHKNAIILKIDLATLPTASPYTDIAGNSINRPDNFPSQLSEPKPNPARDMESVRYNSLEKSYLLLCCLGVLQRLLQMTAGLVIHHRIRRTAPVENRRSLAAALVPRLCQRVQLELHHGTIQHVQHINHRKVLASVPNFWDRFMLVISKVSWRPVGF